MRLAGSSFLPFCVILATLGFTSPIFAQFPQHRLQAIYPNGGKVGENVDLTVVGTDLEGLDGLRFDHPGLRAFQTKGPAFRVAIAPGTPTGPHEVRLQGRLGLSNPRTFFVGDRAEIHETEPNNSRENANAISPGTVVNGRMDPATDVDMFAFEGKAAQRIVIELSAGRLESPLLAVLRLFDPDGREIADTGNEATVDPVLDVVLPADGRYVLEAHDVIFGGSPSHTYRLTIGDAPRVLAISPTAAVPGVESTFTVFGRGIGGQVAEGVQVGGNPVESKSFTWTPPLETSHAPGLDPLGIREVGRRGWLMPVDWLGAFANRPFLNEAEAALVAEVEPNGPETPQIVVPPCDISAAFGSEGDLDAYQFTAKKGEVWLIEAIAERSGSPADPGYVIQKVNAKGEPTDLISAQDLNGVVPGFVLADRSDDTWLRWIAPEDGTYRVVVGDLYGSQRGDLRLTYRLVIRPEHPDFHLFVMAPNDAATNPSSVTLRAGGRAEVQILAQRVDDFKGPIVVDALDLPPGVTASACEIGPGLMQATMVLTAVENLPDGEFRPRFVGRSKSGDRKEILDYDAGKSRVVVERTHDAVPMTWVRPPVNPTASKTPEIRAMSEFVVALRSEAPFFLTTTPAEVVLGPGETIDLTVNLVRHAGFTEAVALTTADLPPNLPAVSGTIAKEATSATLKLAVPANVPPGSYTILVRGSGPFPFAKDPNAKEKPNVTASEPSNPLILTVRRP